MKKVIAILAAVLLVSLSVMPAFAADVVSPKPTKANYNIVINVEDGGSASYDIIKNVDDNGNEVIKVHADPEDGFVFDGWVVDNGTATGDLSDPDAELTVSSDVVLTAKFKQSGVEPSKEQPTKKVTPSPSPKPGKDIDNGSKSPQTGSNDAFSFVALSVVALALVSTVVIAKKASKK